MSPAMQDGTLSINGVRQEDRGYYICSALSAAGSLAAKAHLEVVSIENAPPPVIDLGPANQTLPLDTSATLPCRASGTYLYQELINLLDPPWIRQVIGSATFCGQNPALSLCNSLFMANFITICVIENYFYIYFLHAQVPDL